MKYGCVSPTPEVEDVDHSDSESSNASFEIVSAEGLNDSQSTTSSFKPCVKFHDIFDVYPMDADIVARVSTSDDFKMSPHDKVVVVPLAWTSVDQAVCVSKLNGFYVRFDVNELPKAPADQFYQLCYCTIEGNIVGVSTPFFFREVHEEDLMEFQKEQNKEFWTFRSRFAVLTDLYWNAVKNNETTALDKVIENCGAKKGSETIINLSTESCSANKDADTTEKNYKSSIESCSANKASDTTEKSSAETANEKCDDPVQPQTACVDVDQKSTIPNQEISDQQPNDDASKMESEMVTESVDEGTLNTGALRKSELEFVEEFLKTSKDITLKLKEEENCSSLQEQKRLNLVDFEALPEHTIGGLVLGCMKTMPLGQLETDPVLCEARRRILHDTLMPKNGERTKIQATKQTKEPVEPIAEPVISLTSKIKSQDKLIQDLKARLVQESITIEAYKLEYLACKNDAEKRLRACAKEYAKLCVKLKLRHSPKRDH